ncbi:MAG: glycine--tRNA ligase subunit beta [Burkholderiaceae bacterium]
MSTTKSLLVELFVEELPPKALNKLAQAFAQGLFDGLKSRRLSTEDSAWTPFVTPRRLAVHVSAVRLQAPDEEVTRKIMPVSIGLDAHGRPTEALRKSLAKLGRIGLADAWPDAAQDPERLFVQADGKTQALFLRSLARGSSLLAGLQGALDDSIQSLPIAKLMSYQLEDGWSSVSFARPVHAVVALHGSEVVPVTALGLVAGRTTRGHRFEAEADPVVLIDADHYERQLEEQGAVLASFAARHDEISRQVHAAAAALGLTPIEDADLLDEVTGLVERPHVVSCEFERQFLDVPQECLILTMKANQKYFPLLDAAGRLSNKFLVVSNIRPADVSRVIGGNQRVVRPRLADAKFFFDQDRKRSLGSRVPGLDKVVYHHQLGSLGDRVRRVRAIASEIGRTIGQDPGGDVLAEQADTAARLAKADLLTDMVGEFPELQGIMGGYYARHDGLSEAVALAIEDHYKPRFAGDSLPRNSAGIVVALADKLEILAGLFSIGQAPTGEKDPFALRRHALGVVRLLVERRADLPLSALLAIALREFPGAPQRTGSEVQAFVGDRLSSYLRDCGFSSHEVDAVTSAGLDSLHTAAQRLAAVREFSGLPQAEALAAANKRVANILRKNTLELQSGTGGMSACAVNPGLLVEPAERALHEALQRVAPEAQRLFDAQQYAASLRALAALKEPVDAFFDTVMVNADKDDLRANRLGLLESLSSAMNRVADLSKLAA